MFPFFFFLFLSFKKKEKIHNGDGLVGPTNLRGGKGMNSDYGFGVAGGEEGVGKRERDNSGLFVCLLS